jgi:ADP-heptose:LPS heptosyltransferase
MAKLEPHKIVISRTDSIGDVILTLPLAGILKKHYPKATIIFLGNTYTKAIIETCEHVDEIWEWAIINELSYDDQLVWLQKQEVDTFIHVFPQKEIARLAKKAKIKTRIGTAHRSFHIISCNVLLNFSRKRSNLHEAQLNTKLLAPFGIKKRFSLKELSEFVGFTKILPLPERLSKLIDSSKKMVILHPKSQGSAAEWGVANFVELSKSLDSNSHQVFFTGTEKESEFFRSKIPKQSNIVDVSGQMNLHELIAFIAQARCLVAASTGPLHIAGAVGISAIGLFQNKKPIHAGRWKPLGNQNVIINSEIISEQTQPLKIDVRLVLKAINNLA